VSLEFYFKDFIDEISAISFMAKKLIRPDSLEVLPSLRRQLEDIQTYGTHKSYKWSIQDERPLFTAPTKEFEPGGRGSFPIFASLTSIWEIRPLTKPRRSHPQKFELVGIGSTRIRLFKGTTEDPQEIAMWRMEIGNDDSPGCHFHTQILGESQEVPFPRTVPIPRLPGFFASPAFAFEFVLGELFQDSWIKESIASASHLQRWKTIQRDRLIKLFEWQKGQLTSEYISTPWTHLKRLKPKKELFLS
jgi:hypothetical protein